MKKILAVLLMTLGLAALMPVQAADDDGRRAPSGDERSMNHGEQNGDCKPPRKPEGEEHDDKAHKHPPKGEQGKTAEKGNKQDDAHGKHGCGGPDDSNGRSPRQQRDDD